MVLDRCMPATIDLQKDMLTTQNYGLDHIDKLLEEELAHLKSLKTKKSQDSLPILKTYNNNNNNNNSNNNNHKANQVEGLVDYKKRVQEKTKSKVYEATTDEKRFESTTFVGPFSEMNHDFTRDGRITEKGEVPFFKVSADRRSLSKYRLPRLLDPEAATTANCVDYQLRTISHQNSRKKQRNPLQSGKIVRAQGRLFKTDSFSSDSDQDDITESLKVQYCNLTTREPSEHSKDDKTAIKKNFSSSESEFTKKPFHLACTRDPQKNQPITSQERECSFCAGSVCFHTRNSQTHMVKNGRPTTRKIKTSEKPFLPQIKTGITKEEVKNECEKCRNRCELAEQNRTALATSQRKRYTLTSLPRKERPRLPTANEHAVDQSKKKDVPEEDNVFECTAYLHDDGSLSILPGAFILNDNDYNVWSRTEKTQPVETTQQTLVSNSSLPRLVQ